MVKSSQNPSDDKFSREVNDFLDRTKKERAAAEQRERDSVAGRVAKLGKDIGLIAETIRAFGTGFGWVKDNVIDPVYESPYIGPSLKWAAKKIYNGYYNFTHPYPGENALQSVKKAIFNRYEKTENAILNIFRRDKIAYELPVRERGPLSKTRAGVVSLMSAWALASALSTPYIPSFDYWTTEPLVDSARMLATATFNAVSGNGFQLNHRKLHYGIPAPDGEYDLKVSASVIKDNRKEEDSYMFHSRERLLNELWSLWNGHGSYVPWQVLGPIKPNDNICESIYYGSTWKVPFFKSLRGNPEVLNVNCGAENGVPSGEIHPVPESPALRY